MTEYGKALMANATIRKLKQKADSGTITAKEMNRLVGEYGRLAGRCMRDQLLSKYPDGHVSEDDIRVVVAPVMHQMHGLISEAMAQMLNAQYGKLGVGLKAVIPEYDKQREDELVRDLSRRSFEDELE